jgi:hypothetical protein
METNQWGIIFSFCQLDFNGLVAGIEIIKKQATKSVACF